MFFGRKPSPFYYGALVASLASLSVAQAIEACRLNSGGERSRGSRRRRDTKAHLRSTVFRECFGYFVLTLKNNCQLKKKKIEFSNSIGLRLEWWVFLREALLSYR